MVQAALSSGHQVTAFVHSTNPFEKDKNLHVLEGDIYVQADVNKAISKDTDAVISALGSWGTPKKNILTVGIENIMPAMQKNGVKRIVTLTGNAALTLAEDVSIMQRINRSLLGLFAPKILLDGENHLALLGASELDWTCIRSPVMTERGGADYTLQFQSPKPWQTVKRVAVAHCLLDQLEDTNFIRTAPYIIRN